MAPPPIQLPKATDPQLAGWTPSVTPSIPKPGQTAAEAASGAVDFAWSRYAEPHAMRRKAILAKYGARVKTLYGHDWSVKWKVAISIAVQVAIASVAGQLSWWGFLLVAYSIGGVVNHSMTLAMHEVSHNLAFKSFAANRAFGIITNLPLGIPAFAMFKRYHSEHHRYQGEDGIDVDVPSSPEIWLFNSRLGKVVWMFLQPAFYALRPMVVLPKEPRQLEAINWAAQLAFDAAIYWACGWQGVLYLVASTLLGMGMHPMAGHFVAEHYTFVRGQETYSYYGLLNWFSFNVGYHNEHHDFPFIPGSRLPQLRLIAPEFYEPLPYHGSWTNVVLEYIWMSQMGPQSRIKRDTLSKEERHTLITGTAAGQGESG